MWPPGSATAIVVVIGAHEGLGPGRGVPLPGEGSGAKPRKLTLLG